MNNSIERFIFLSGTVSGFHLNSPAFTYFMGQVGINTAADDIIVSNVLFDAIGHARLGRLCFADPTPMDIFVRDKKNELILSPAFIQYTGRVIVNAIALEHATDRRGVGIFVPSYDTLEKISAEIVRLDPTLASRIIREGTEKVGNLVRRFNAADDPIWMGVSWSGLNFVRPDGQTTMTRIIIPRMKIKPGREYHNNNDWNDAARSLVQAIGRGMRSSADRPDVHILDYRMTPHYTTTRLNGVMGSLRRSVSEKCSSAHIPKIDSQQGAFQAVGGIRPRWFTREGEVDIPVMVWRRDGTLI